MPGRDGISLRALRLLKRISKLKRKLLGGASSLSKMTLILVAYWSRDKRLLDAIKGVENSQLSAWQKLNDLAEVARILDDQGAYIKAIKEYDSLLGVCLESFSFSRFLGTGLGPGTLNAFRQVIYKDQMLFEKIYCNYSDDFAHIEWYGVYLYDSLVIKGIHAPKIVRMLRGEKVTAVYFEFINNPLDNLKTPLTDIIDIAQNITNIKLSTKAESQDSTYDVRSLDIYQACYNNAIKGLAECDLLLGDPVALLASLEQVAMGMPKTVTHGDLHGKNIGKPNIVIDWDRCGYYPFGMDLGYILSNNYSYQSFNQFHDDLMGYLRIEQDSLTSSCLFSIGYFSLLFYTRKWGKGISKKKWCLLFNRLLVLKEELGK